MKRVAILLGSDILNDSRVINIMTSLNSDFLVDLFYVYYSDTPSQHNFGKNIRLFGFRKKTDIISKCIMHTCFYNEFNFFVKEVLSKKISYDYIYANDLPCLKPAVLIKRKNGGQLIYDSHEIYNETLNQFFPQKCTWHKQIAFRFLLFTMKKLGTRAERKYIKNADKVITVGEGLKKYFENNYDTKDIRIVMNCPRINNNFIKLNLVEKLGLPENSFLVLYQGVLNMGRGLNILINAFSHTNKNIFLIVIGDGFLKKDLIQTTTDLGLDKNIFFLNTIPQDILMNYTSGANLGINLLEPVNLSKALAAPNKLFQYVHAGIPVLASFSFENDLFLKKYKVGVQVKNDSLKIAEMINTLSKEDLSVYRENCKNAQREYSWENQEKVLKSTFV